MMSSLIPIILSYSVRHYYPIVSSLSKFFTLINVKEFIGQEQELASLATRVVISKRRRLVITRQPQLS